MMNDGIRIKWDKGECKTENKITNEKNEKVALGNTKTIQGYETEWCQDLWKDAAMGVRVLGFFSEDPRSIENAYPTPVFRLPKILPGRTISEKGGIRPRSPKN